MSVSATMRDKLERAFMPVSLDIVDESNLHAGHAGHSSRGDSHFSVAIVADAFAGKSRLDRQRMVFAVLDDELKGGVHALRMALKTPEEAGVPAS